MPRYSADYIEVYGPQTLCKCPRCEQSHTMWIKYIGRGIPKKYCPRCQVVVSYRSGGMDGMTELNKHALQRSSMSQ